MYHMMPFFLDLWGCIPELSKNCTDMTNASSTYLGIVMGAIVGGIVSWWIYNRQKRTTEQQDKILGKIKDLEENHSDILKKLEDFDDKHESSFDAIQELNRKIDVLLKKSDQDSKVMTIIICLKKSICVLCSFSIFAQVICLYDQCQYDWYILQDL